MRFTILFLASLTVTVGFAAVLWESNKEANALSNSVAQQEEYIAELESELLEFQPEDDYRFVQISNRVAAVDCPRYFLRSSSTGNAHCAFAYSPYQDPSFQIWFGTIEVTGTFMMVERDDIWAMEAGAPLGTKKVCYSIEVIESSPEFNGKLFQNSKHVSLPPTLISIPYNKLSQVQKDLLSNSEPTSIFKYTGIRDSYIASVSGDVCGSGFDHILSIEKVQL